jgi:hypothetical protein
MVDQPPSNPVKPADRWMDLEWTNWHELKSLWTSSSAVDFEEILSGFDFVFKKKERHCTIFNILLLQEK